MNPFSEPISELSDAVIYVAQTTANFKPQLKQLNDTLDIFKPMIVDIQNLNQIQLDNLIDEIQDAQKIVLKCLKIKKNVFKKFTHSLKLKDVNANMLKFFLIGVQMPKMTMPPHPDGVMISNLSLIVRYVAHTTTNFKPQLKRLGYTLDKLKASSIGTEDSSEFKAVILRAKNLVLECPKIKWNLFKKFNHSLMLMSVNDMLYTIQNIPIGVNGSRESRYDTEDAPPQASFYKDGSDMMERRKWGWQVPMLPRGIVTMDEPLKKLKAVVLAVIPYYDDCGSSPYFDDDDGFLNERSSILVVSAAGGCGKTTLVNILCNDPQIHDKYGQKVFYVKVSETPNFMVIVSDLYNRNSFNQEAMFQSNEEAKNMLEIFLRKFSGPILLVLDDVWSDSFIKNFEFDIKGYKILVTSKMIFPKYDVFQLDPLSDEDAKTLFHHSAFSDSTTIPGPTIDEDLVNQMVQCCKKHPLALSVVGSSLSGKDESVWKSVLKTLSQGEWVLDNKNVLRRLERTIEELDEEFKKCILGFEALDEEFKHCLLDLGLFPGVQRISACALLDVWVNLYGHDDTGKDTLTKIFQLSYRKLVSSVTIGKEANAIVNYCEQTFVTQQDLLREPAIHLSSKEPVAQRTRLIIDTRGKYLPASITQVQEPMIARILSISTGELFSSRWCNLKVPEVEVLVLNLQSETYTLPHFLKEMQKLKIINVTNYGPHPAALQSIHLLGSSTNLMRIRLERVVISPLSTSFLSLVNLKKLSFITCKIGNAFEKLTSDKPNVWPRLVEIEMDNCQDLVGFPEIFCNCAHLEKLSITNCNQTFELPEEFGRLTTLETLSLRSCTKLEKLPKSITRLQNLCTLDISDCSSLSELPYQIGKLGVLRMVYMKGCTGIHELPPSVKDLSHTQVLCNEEVSHKWKEFPNVKILMVEEDRLLTLTNNFSYSHI